MTRFLLSLGLALVAFLVLAGAVALLAYGAEPSREGTLRVPGLDAEARLSWSPAGEVSIAADDEAAMWTALGYAHGADHGWSVAVWRQAALGQLSRWVGTEATDLDRHARQLGFGALARQSYARLDDADRAAVDAYARGMRLAFADDAVAERDEFVELDVDAERWEPWHALAIERMVAWLATPTPARGTTQETRDFADADSLFRHALALGGLRHARAYTGPTSEGAALVYHQPYGSSALPLLVGARVALGGRERVVATVPGTLMLPASSGEWAVLLTSRARTDRDTSAAPPPVYSRLVDRDGDETLLRVWRDARGLVLRKREDAPRDTLAVEVATGEPILAAPTVEELGARLRWSGFSPGSDVGAFRALLAGDTPTFRLLVGQGLRMAGGQATPMVTTAVARRGDGWTFVSDEASSAPATRRLAALARGRVTPDALAQDTGSPWALEQSRTLVRSLGNRDSLTLDLQDAYAFLRGWDGYYTPEAIAPSIAEAWIEAHRRAFGRAPEASRADSALISYTLRLGVASLRDSLGREPGTWTWDRFSGELRQPLLAGRARFAPTPARAGGHPTSPLPGPSLLLDAPPGPAVFSMWGGSGFARTDHPALPVTRTRGRDTRVVRMWPRAGSPTLTLAPAR